jgi:hypothetical protein
MRRIGLALAAALLTTASLAAGAAPPPAEARAYFGFEFGARHAAAPHLGLRLDRYDADDAAALAQLDFSRRSVDAFLHGARILHAETPAGETPKVEEGADSTGWSWVQWTMLGVAVAAGAAIFASTDSAPRRSTATPPASNDSGTPCTVTTPTPLPPGCTPFAGVANGGGIAAMAPAWLAELDRGTGQMGDLRER